MLPDEIVAHIEAQDVSASDGEARRILAHAIAEGGSKGRAPRQPVARRLTDLVHETTNAGRLEVVERVTDASDGFVKYLLRSPDGALSEAVRIPLKKAGCFSVCLSTQVGCAMRCAFCATGRLGFSRNLRAWEMVHALMLVRDEAPGRITGAVFMGQGEPFQNYDAVIRAAAILSNPCGACIRAENISISTVGLVPFIRRYTREGHRYRLIVSMTSAIPDRRRALMPAAGEFSVEDLAEALGEHARRHRDRVTVAWVVMAGVNTGADEVAALARLFAGVPLRLNLIDVNDARPDGFSRASDDELNAFRDRLQVLGVPIVRRYSGGRERHAACGMLAAHSKRAAEITR